MAEVKNKGGAPKGHTNSSKANRRWRQAIDKATKQYKCSSDDPKKIVKAGEALDAMAFRLVDIALNGQGSDMVFAFKEIGQRLDGKSTEHKVISAGSAAEGLEGLSEAVKLLQHFGNWAGNQPDEGVVPH